MHTYARPRMHIHKPMCTYIRGTRLNGALQRGAASEHDVDTWRLRMRARVRGGQTPPHAVTSVPQSTEHDKRSIQLTDTNRPRWNWVLGSEFRPLAREYLRSKFQNSLVNHL